MAENPNKETFPLFSFSNQNQTGFGFFASEKPVSVPPPPCLEVLLSEVSTSEKSTMDSVKLNEKLTFLKGRVSTKDVFGVSNSDLVPGKYEGGLKLWEGSLDLIKTLYSEVQDGRLSLTRKRVLELGCGHGLPGIFTCIEGAAVVHFQDFNAEVLKCLTIPNVKANLSNYSLLQQCLSTETTETSLSAEVRFFAGDWSEIDCMFCPEKHSDSSLKQDPSNGYDIILMAETVYSLSSLQNLYCLIKKCLHTSGVIFLAAKKHYFGVGGGTRQFLSVVEEDGAMDSCLIAEVADGSSNVREIWKFSFKK